MTVQALTRRDVLRRTSMGFGALALSDLLLRERGEAAEDRPQGKPPHHKPRAQNVIFLYMDGGISQVDAFDPKPQLAKDSGKKSAF